MARFDLLLYPLVAAHGESPSFLEYLVESNVFNFLIAVLILGWIFKKAGLFSFFDTQRAKIAQDIERVEAERAKANEALKAIESRTASLAGEVEAILAQAKQSAEALSTQIVEDAQAEAGKIIEASKRRIELEQASAAKGLQKRLLGDALSDARAELAGNLDKNTQKLSVEAFIDELERSGK